MCSEHQHNTNQPRTRWASMKHCSSERENMKNKFFNLTDAEVERAPLLFFYVR